METAPISCLQFAQFLRLWFMRVDRKALIDEEIPDFLPTLPRVKRFVLRIAYPTEFFVGCRWLRAIRLTHQLDYAFALVDFFPQH